MGGKFSKKDLERAIRTGEKRSEIIEGRLSKVHKVFSKWLFLDNYRMIDVALAIYLSRKMDGTPIWIIFVGPSGDGKSELVMSLDFNDDSYVLHELTSNTLVSGQRKSSFDLAPQINGKIVLLPDMAQILKLHPNEKAQVWAQLRELYDGRAGKRTGVGGRNYQDLRVTLLGCSTSSIDSQILIHQDLGTRELIFRTKEENYRNSNNRGLMNKVWANEQYERRMREELKEVVEDFLTRRKILKINISEAVKKELEDYVSVLRFLRASAELDSSTGELLNLVHPEQPSRCLKQLKRLFICLKSLDKEYSDDKALDCIRHIVISSCPPNRWKVLSTLLRLVSKGQSKISIYRICQELRLGYKTVFRELNVLWNLGLIERLVEIKERYVGYQQEVYYWTVDSNKQLIQAIQKIYSAKNDGFLEKNLKEEKAEKSPCSPPNNNTI